LSIFDKFNVFVENRQKAGFCYFLTKTRLGISTINKGIYIKEAQLSMPHIENNKIIIIFKTDENIQPR
jgi:hypothetical protein